MSVQLQGSVFNRLSNNVDLLPLLAEWSSGLVGRALVSVPVPNGFVVETIANTRPVCLIDIPSDIGDRGDYSHNMRELTLNVRFYAKPEGRDPNNLYNAVEVTRAFIRTMRGSYPGGEILYTDPVGPLPAPVDNPQLLGLMVSAQFMVKED